MNTKLHEKIIYKELSYAIQGCCFDIRKTYGPGQKEIVYANLLAECLEEKGIPFEREKRISIRSAKTGKVVGVYQPDFVIDGKIILEVKSSRISVKQDEKQLYHYLRNSEFELGYLVNFSTPQLFIKRIIYTNDRKPFLARAIGMLSCLFVFLFVWISVVTAQEQELKIALGPPTIEREVIRGQTLEERIAIVNKSEVPLPFKVVARNWTAKGEAGDIEFYEDPDATIAFNPREWLTLGATDIILQPQEHRSIPVTISIPENAEPGGHYVMVNFESLLPAQYFKEGQPRILPQIGSLFFLTVHVPDFIPLEQPFAFEEFSIPKAEIRRPLAFLKPIPVVRAAADIAFIDRALKTLTLRIKNKDIVHHKPQGEVQVLNTLGQVVARQETPETTILPGKIRSIPINFTPLMPTNTDTNGNELIRGDSSNIRGNWWTNVRGQLVAGRYTALVRIGEGDQVVQAKVAVWAFPWKLGILSTVLVAPLLYFVIRWRKRFWPAFRALTRGKSTNNQ